MTTDMQRPPVATTEGRPSDPVISSEDHDLDAPQVVSWRSTTYADVRGVLANAVKLAEAGHPILPCYTVNGGDRCTCKRSDKKTGELCRSGKHPNFELAPNGLKDATTDPATLLEWFDRTGGSINFGWRLDGLGVVDVDTNDGKTGADTMATLEAGHDALSPTLLIRTGRGGLQHVYELPEEIEDTSAYTDELGPFVDFKRGAGHYVMVPGSKTIDVYRVESGDLLKREPLDGWVHDLALNLGSLVNRKRSAADKPIKAGGTNGPVLDLSSWDTAESWLNSAAKPGDDPTRGNTVSASFVGGIVRDTFNAGQGIHVAMRLALLTEMVSEDKQDPEVIGSLVKRLWKKEEAKQDQDIDQAVADIEAGGDPAEILANLSQGGEFKTRFRETLIRKLADKKADDVIAGKTDDSDMDPEPEDHDAFLSAEPPGWLIQGLWPKGAYGVLAAQKKAGKTWAGLDLAIAVASGGKWLGEFQCKQGKVVYALGEGSRFAALQRVRAIAEFHGVDVENLIREDQLVPVLQPVQITNAKHLQRVRDWMDKYEPALLVVDPFYLSQGTANGTNLAEMGETLREIQVICNSRGCSLMFVHHFKKGSASGADQLTGVGLQEWARVIGVANITSEEQIDRGTQVTLKWSFSGEMAPASFSVVRQVWTDDPSRQDAPQHYTASVEKATGGKANEGKLPLTPVQDLLYDAIAAVDSATPANVFTWLEENRKKRSGAKTADSIKEALRRFREKRPDLIGHRQVDNTIEYRLNDAETLTMD
ncbi:AAA family ATPase [Streptomyces globisporus]|uniref:AAA family ATPase n=1 Tax=Streptomyces globisporus TaxID=1908 RepID=UPI00365DBCF4